jgi:hypothetical protein
MERGGNERMEGRKQNAERESQGADCVVWALNREDVMSFHCG